MIMDPWGKALNSLKRAVGPKLHLNLDGSPCFYEVEEP